MKLLREAPSGDEPRQLMALDLCVAHRCRKHHELPPLNGTDNGAECGGCVAEEFGKAFAEKALETFQWPVLDALADRLTHSARLRQKLESARARLNLIEPGLGDQLAEDR